MRRVHIVLAAIYGMIWITSAIYTWAHLSYLSSKASSIWAMGTSNWVVIWPILYILKALKKERTALKSWYPVILPAIYAVTATIMIAMYLMNSSLYDANSRSIRISYLAVAIQYASIAPAMWHLRMNKAYRDELRQGRDARA